VEKERDYYFSKLREVELLCQEHGEESAPFVERLMEVLYASDEQVSPQFQIDLSRIQDSRCLFRLQPSLCVCHNHMCLREIISFFFFF